MGYTTRKIDRTELHLLVPLMQDCFGMDVDVEYFKWKFLDNPAGPFIGFCAFDDATGECAAYYGVIPEAYFIDGKPVTIFQSGDTMTHGRHRRKGLFFLLATECFNYLKSESKLFVIGFGGIQSTPGLLKLGWKHLFPIRYYGMVPLQCRLNRVWRSIAKPKHYEAKSTADYSTATRLAGNDPKYIRQSYEPAFLQWRLGNPRLKYKYEELRYRNEPIGYFSYCILNGKIFLLDSDLTDLSHLAFLKQRLCALTLDTNSKGLFTFSQQGVRFNKLIRKMGLLSNPFHKGPLSERLPFMVYATEQDSTWLSDPAHWEVRPISHDSY